MNFTIEGLPKGKGRPRFTRSGHTYTPDTTRKYEALVTARAKEAMIGKRKIEKPKATRAKPKTSCPFSPDDSIPPEYLEYAQAKHPSINAQAEFTKFVNFHLSKDNRYSNWLAAWRTWATKAEEFAKSRPQSQSYTPRNNKPLIFDEAYYGDGSF